MNEDIDGFETMDGQGLKNFSAESRRSTWKTVALFVAAAILVFVFVNSKMSARSAGYSGFLLGGSCCSSGDTAEPGRISGGSCCGGTSQSDSTNLESLRQAGLDFHRQNYEDGPVEAVVKDYGCHQEVHIYQDGQLVYRLVNLNGEMREL